MRRGGTLERCLSAGAIGLAAALLALALALLLNACASLPRVVLAPPSVPGANYVGNRACLDCHSNYVASFHASPHSKVRFNVARDVVEAGCESCHGPGSRHVEVGGGRGRFIVNPGKDPATCLTCHLHTHSEFTLAHHHPVLENRMNCVQCHDPHGRDIFKRAGGLAMARQNETCAACHREQTRPFVFEHEALREGCTVCHNPHGSVNPKLLTQTDPNLCLRCHAQSQGVFEGSRVIFIGGKNHTFFLNRATCWASGCHTAVHGSNVDPTLRY